VPVPEASRRTALWARVSVGDVDDREFFRSVADRAGLSREEATDLTRATLQALAQRLSQGAVRELVLHLPDRLAEQVGGIKGRPSRHSGLADAEKQISDHTGLRRDEVHVGFAACSPPCGRRYRPTSSTGSWRSFCASSWISFCASSWISS